jgi:hypothetical protein
VPYHHLPPETVEDMWKFEQQWIKVSLANDFPREKVADSLEEQRR